MNSSPHPRRAGFAAPGPLARLASRAVSRLAAGAVACAALLLAACDTGRADSGTGNDGTNPDPAAAPAPATLATGDLLPGYPAADAEGRVRLSEAEWRERLTPDQFRILRGSGTERPFSCPLWKISDEPGVYHCAGCGLALFRSTDKFDSGTGWPSFTRPVARDRVLDRADHTYGMVRVENVCARCEGHLGHVFPDGPPPTGLRYCINGTALVFAPASAEPASARPAAPAKAQP